MKISGDYLFAFALITSIACVTWIDWELQKRLDMAQTHAHFTVAIKTARQNISPDMKKLVSFSESSLPTMQGAPSNTGEWISLFATHANLAPGGGPAYIVNQTGN